MCVLDFVKDDAGRLVDTEEPNNGAQGGQAEHPLVVGHWQEENIIVFDAL